MHAKAEMQVPLSRPPINDDDVAAVLEVLRSSSLSMGPKVRESERAVARHAGTAEAVAVNGGTGGLHRVGIAAQLRRLAPRDDAEEQRLAMSPVPQSAPVPQLLLQNLLISTSLG